jgi:hypothetical protein
MPAQPAIAPSLAGEADLLKQKQQLGGVDDDLPARTSCGRQLTMNDPLIEVALRVYADFAAHASPAEVVAVISRCRHDLDTPSAAAIPELVERLARQRLTNRITADQYL